MKPKYLNKGLKYLSNNKLKFTETNLNLGINNYSIYSALKPAVIHNNMFSPEYNMNIKTIPSDFNTWSKIKINGRDDHVSTIPQLIFYLENTYNIKPQMITCGNNIIYNSLSKPKKKNFIKKLYEKLDKGYKEYIFLDLCLYDEMGIPIITPPVIYSYI